MPRFIHEANIAHFKERIANETNPAMLATLRKLLAGEADYDAQHPRSASALKERRFRLAALRVAKGD